MTEKAPHRGAFSVGEWPRVAVDRVSDCRAYNGALQ